MITVITSAGDPFTYHLTYQEAEKYLEELKKVYPQGDWELEPKTTGRLRGHDEMIWGGECVVDALDLSVHQWMKVYLFKPISWKPPELHVQIYRYIPCTFETTDETEAKREVRKQFKDMEFKLLEGMQDQVVRYK